MISERKASILKAAKFTAHALWWCVLVLLFVLLVNIFSSKITGKVPDVFGYSVMNIVSGSMEDEIPKDSYILIKKCSPEEVKKDDVICFYSSESQIYGIPNTHRVVEDPIINSDGSIEFVTRGDACVANDEVTAKGGRLIGVYVRRLDALTSFSNALKQNTLIFVIIGLQISLVAMAVYTVVVLKNKKNTNESGSEDRAQK
jgi:signal peptidase